MNQIPLLYLPLQEALADELEATDTMKRIQILRNQNPLDVKIQRSFLDAYASYQVAMDRVMVCIRIQNQEATK